MPMPIPPWIRPASPEYYMQGFSQGEGIAERQNRAEAAIQEMTMRRQAQDQANQLHAVQLATSLQDFALRKQVADEKAREAAMKWQGQQKYQSVLDAGGTPQEAFSASAHLLMPGQLWHIPAMAQSQANAEANRALREREVVAREKALEARTSVKPDVTVITDPITGIEHSAMRTGPNTYRLMAGEKPTGEQKNLSAIQERSLVAEQRELEKNLLEARRTGTKKEIAKIEADLLGNKTAQTNLVLSARPTRNVPEEPWDKYAPFNIPKGKLTEEKAREYLKSAQGNKARARQMALAEGWEL